MPRLLLIDDDPLVLSTLNRLIRAVCPGLDIEPVGDPRAARDRLAPGAFDAVLTDRNMPGVSGEDVLARAKDVCPGAVRGLLTGDLADAGWHRPDRLAFAHLQKPCRPADLKRGVGTMIDLAAAAADPALAKAVATFARFTAPAAGEMPYDGRTAGARWFEAVGVFAGANSRRPSSASVLRALGADLSRPLGILVGAFEAVARLDAHLAAPIWEAALDRARSVTDHGGEEQARVGDRLTALARSVGDLAIGVTKCAAPAAAVAAVLLHSWGFTADVIGPLFPGPAAPPSPAVPAPRLDRSPFAYAGPREAAS